MIEKSLEEKIQYLEDIEAIKKLQFTYADHVNIGWQGREFRDVSSLFTEEATLDNDDFNLHAKGNKEVSAALKQGSAFPIAQHSFYNPIIEINGDKATGKWLLWVGIQKDKEANLVFESEDVEYVRTGEGWKISSIKLYVAQMLKPLQ